MSYSLSVALLRPVRVNDLFSLTRTTLADLTRLADGLEIQWEYPPNPKVRAALMDPLSEGVSFYVTLVGVADGSLVDLGIIDPKWRAGDPIYAYFCVHSFPPANVLALAMAIAAAELAGSNIEDGSGHWFAEEMNAPLDATAKFRLAKSPGDPVSALSQIDALLNWKNSDRKRARLTRPASADRR